MQITEALKKLMEENATCFDCGKFLLLLLILGQSAPLWTSINNGVFICFRCSEIHRMLGSEISTVKSVHAGGWDPFLLSYLKAGGNSRFKAFLDRYGTNSEYYTKYQTKAAEYYRRKLLSKVEGIFFNLPEPSLEEGKEFASGSTSIQIPLE